MKLTATQLTALVVYLLGRYRAVVRDKGDAFEMKVIAAVFGVAALLGADVPTSEEFFTRYWTTLGPVVYAPRGVDSLTTHARVICHELTHAVQFWRDPVSFATATTSTTVTHRSRETSSSRPAPRCRAASSAPTWASRRSPGCALTRPMQSSARCTGARCERARHAHPTALRGAVPGALSRRRRAHRVAARAA